MKTSSAVRLHALVSIEPQDWQNFELRLAETIQIVQKEGDNVVTHECYRQSGTDDCLIIEAYVSEKAFLSHLTAIEPLAKIYPVEMIFKRVELAGPYSQETVRAIKESTNGCDLLHFDAFPCVDSRTGVALL